MLKFVKIQRTETSSQETASLAQKIVCIVTQNMNVFNA